MQFTVGEVFNFAFCVSSYIYIFFTIVKIMEPLLIKFAVSFLVFSVGKTERLEKRLGYVCNPRSLKEGTETSRRMTDELGSRQRDLSTSSVTKRANGHWHAIIASSCRCSQREYKRQPVHRINHVFAEEPSRRPGRPAVVQQLWRRDVTSPFPPSGNEGYIRNRDVPFQSVTPSHVGCLS